MIKLDKEHLTLLALAVVVLGSFTFLALLFYQYTPKVDIKLSLEKREPVVNEEGDGEYDRQIQAIFRRYLKKRTRLVEVAPDEAQKDWSVAVKEAKQELLELRVGSNSLEKHLQLILSLDKLSDYLAGKSLLDAISIEKKLIKLFN